MTTDCLYCGLRFPDTARFCPNCGRHTEKDFTVRPIQADELECLRKQVREKDALIRQLSTALQDKASHATGRTTTTTRIVRASRAKTREPFMGRSGRRLRIT